MPIAPVASPEPPPAVDGRSRVALIPYSRVGGGHESIAFALAAALERQRPGAVVARPADIYLSHSRFPVTLVPALYATLMRRHPVLWSALFRLANTRLTCQLPALSPFLFAGVSRLLSEQRPDVVVSVIPVVNQLLSGIIKRQSPRPRFEVLITEWADIHRSWIAPGVDRYLVATQDVKRDCIRFGVPQSRVDVIGFPVRDSFRRIDLSVDRGKILLSIGLDPQKFTILLMVGGEGAPNSASAIRVLLNLQIDAQAIIVCGRDERLFMSLTTISATMEYRALRFVENIWELMKASDLLVTKAGASTLAEAFVVGIPVIVNDVVPGQETGNVRFVAARGAVWVAENPRSLGELVADARRSPDKCEALRACGRALGSADAAQTAAAAILAGVEGPERRRPA